MDLQTYGSSPAAQQLASMLIKRDNHVLTRKVSSCMHDFRVGLREIRKTNMQFTLREMWKHRIQDRIKKAFDREVCNFMLNVVVAECRKEAK